MRFYSPRTMDTTNNSVPPGYKGTYDVGELIKIVTGGAPISKAKADASYEELNSARNNRLTVLQTLYRIGKSLLPNLESKCQAAAISAAKAVLVKAGASYQELNSARSNLSNVSAERRDESYKLTVELNTRCEDAAISEAKAVLVKAGASYQELNSARSNLSTVSAERRDESYKLTVELNTRCEDAAINEAKVALKKTDASFEELASARSNLSTVSAERRDESYKLTVALNTRCEAAAINKATDALAKADASFEELDSARNNLNDFTSLTFDHPLCQDLTLKLENAAISEAQAASNKAGASFEELNSAELNLSTVSQKRINEYSIFAVALYKKRQAVAISEAKALLVKAFASYEELNSALENLAGISDLSRKIFHEPLYKSLELKREAAAISEAITVLAKDDASFEELKSALRNLDSVSNNRIDQKFTELCNQIKEKLDTVVISEARVALAKDDASFEELKSAESNFDHVSNNRRDQKFTELRNQIKEKLDTVVISKAKALLAKDDASYEELNSAIMNLLRSASNEKRNGDFNYLRNKLKEKLDTLVISKAKAALAKDNASYEELGSALRNLESVSNDRRDQKFTEVRNQLQKKLADAIIYQLSI